MPLYELILQKPNGADEIRFTDHEPDAERPLVIDGRSRWRIERVEPATHPVASRRYLCVPIDSETQGDSSAGGG